MKIVYLIIILVIAITVEYQIRCVQNNETVQLANNETLLNSQNSQLTMIHQLLILNSLQQTTKIDNQLLAIDSLQIKKSHEK